ncbi:hypothetical protein C5167_015144 [Papaver somniferum]|uniref:Uncharacterized protein n=1 Tax=Papaver somniferum TaxID=3469 RepID=A0A4Y7J739_PAPSO|nr:hypothetical protein C5167_015144 [Papaver somniferum]
MELQRELETASDSLKVVADLEEKTVVVTVDLMEEVPLSS